MEQTSMTARLLSSTSLEERIKLIRHGVEEQCVRCGREPAEVELMAVSKTVAAEIVNQAYGLGIPLIGENRVQELLSKKDDYAFGREAIEFIGQLQTNKVRKVLPYVRRVQSVDSLRLATQISRCADELGMIVDCLIEVNISEEAAKGGVLPQEAEELVCLAATLSGLRVTGLMTIGENTEDSAKKEANFHKMQGLFIDIGAKKIDNVNMQTLSMGMSGDFLPAVKHGSTLIRLGSALFGARQYR